MRNNLFIINQHGYKYIGYTLFIAFIFSILDLELFSFISFVLALFFIYNFRNPERAISFLDDKAVISPVDGIVSSIDELQDDQYAYKIVIESSYMDVGILRVPVSGHIENMRLIRGTRTSKKSKLFYDLNEMAEVVFTDVNTNKIKVIHHLKQSFLPINIDITKNDTLYKGTRYGYAMNNMSEIYLSKNFRLNIKPNNEVKASQSLIGYFS